MFNVYSYDRKLAQAEGLKQMKEDFITDELRRKSILLFSPIKLIFFRKTKSTGHKL